MFFIFTSLCGFAQDYQHEGDFAFKSGNYAKAIEYYKLAYENNPSDELTKKINLSQTLKTEFDAINSAIQSGNYDVAETHINNVLLMDPTNIYVDAKRKEIEDRQKATKARRRELSTERFVNGFLGDDDVQDRFGGLHMRVGYHYINDKYFKPFGGADSMQSIDPTGAHAIGMDLYFNNSAYFPFTIELGFATNGFFDIKTYRKEIIKMYSGVSFAYRLWPFLNLDLGGGVQWGNVSARTTHKYDPIVYSSTYKDQEKFLNGYIKGGFTLMFHNDVGGGISYHYTSSIGSAHPVQSHSVNYIFGKKPTYWLGGLGLLLGIYAIL